MNKNALWQLRCEIMVNSLCVSDYQNSFDFTPESVCDFFDGYVEYLEELATERYGNGCSLDQIFEFDNAENLCDWYGCFDRCPFQKKCWHTFVYMV